MRTFLMAGLCLSALLAFYVASQAPVATQPDVQGSFSAAPQYSGARVWTGGEANEDRHWREHGSQFPQFTTEQAYVDGARAFVSHPPSGTLTKHRANGDTLYYDPASDEFAVTARDGALRTFFKPGAGMSYWERQ